MGKEGTGLPADGTGGDVAFGDLQGQGLDQGFERDLQQVHGLGQQLVLWQGAVAVANGLQERVGDAGPGAEHGRLLNP